MREGSEGRKGKELYREDRGREKKGNMIGEKREREE